MKMKIKIKDTHILNFQTRFEAIPITKNKRERGDQMPRRTTKAQTIAGQQNLPATS